MDSTSRPALLLVVGRSIGLAASFAIGIVLARLFDPAVFGTYKQFFLVYATLYGVLQLGMAESLYYFVPRQSQHTGRYVANAMVDARGGGPARARQRCTLARTAIGGWLTPELAGIRRPARSFSDVHADVDRARDRHGFPPAAHDGGHHLCDFRHRAARCCSSFRHSRSPPFARCSSARRSSRDFGSLATLVALWREFGRDFRIDLSLWRQQLGYALPFALAVGIEVVLINYHQYVVASRFDAATFAIYAVGCLQIPLFDLDRAHRP